MTYIVNDKCIKCKLMDCVEVCPVDCFYEGKNMLVIKPDECIDCGVCEPECPVDAITADTEPGSEKWLEINKKYSEIWPNISEKKDPQPKHEKNKNKQKKINKYIKENNKKKIPKKKTKKIIKKITKKIAKVKKVLKKKTVKKVTKKVSAKTKKIENKKVINNVAETTEVKTDNLRISKINEVKPEIKKV